ncbi:hypothetical protein [Clavavirus yamagawaense]|uniref:Uncharacterized protein n=1 Tax=Aeropyrum pernix bacilliform virus 1 (isolate -/Japan/Tanaka/2005) TaxID=1289471 RepID=D4QF76_APBV1|nr:hypothetical protein FK791_gp10 [Aeropyrum pernix bacilliform virus 1]BAJ06120.1 hypothetical protein [Aeropyrum pernix bacilliform virus 1]
MRLWYSLRYTPLPLLLLPVLVVAGVVLAGPGPADANTSPTLSVFPTNIETYDVFTVQYYIPSGYTGNLYVYDPYDNVVYQHLNVDPDISHKVDIQADKVGIWRVEFHVTNTADNTQSVMPAFVDVAGRPSPDTFTLIKDISGNIISGVKDQLGVVSLFAVLIPVWIVANLDRPSYLIDLTIKVISLIVRVIDAILPF